MLSLRCHPLLRATLLSLTVSAVVLAQTPSTTPLPQTPAQREATRPPGSTQSGVPPEARPRPEDPTAPPGSQQRTSPQAPPGTELTPRPENVAPTLPGPSVPATSTPSPSTPAPTTIDGERLPEPNFPVAQPRPVPPMPSLVRLGVTGGETVALTLNDAIRRALENNNDIEMARHDVRLAESLLRSFQGQYDPVLSFTPQINNSVTPITNIFQGADATTGTVSRTEFSLGPTLSRRFQTGGGQYDFFFNNSRVMTNSGSSPFDPSYSSSLGVSFTQPLWRDRSIDRTRRDIRIQRKRLEQTDAEFRRRTIEIIAQVQRAYWDLVFALRDEQNQIANLNLARENFRRTEAGVTAGASAPLERAEVQTELSNRESSLLLSSQNVSVAENNLKALMLKDALAREWSAALVPTDQPSFDTAPVNLSDALNEARANRPELRRLRLEQDVSDIDLQYFRNQTRPRVDLTATVSSTGLAGTPGDAAGTSIDQVPLIRGDAALNSDAFLLSLINQLRANPALGLPPATVPLVTPQTNGVPDKFIGGYGRNLRNLFGFETRNIVVGVAIQIPLRNRTAEANLATARIQREQLGAQTRQQEQFVEVDVRNAAQAVETSRRRVLAARSARENAELQLAGERRLYQVGRSTTFLLFQRENQLVNARNQELRAETDYNKALSDLQRATSTTLRVNNVVIESPVLP